MYSSETTLSTQLLRRLLRKLRSPLSNIDFSWALNWGDIQAWRIAGYTS
ncbi:hypothetical protein [Pedobacter nutrimenti]|nr:hypothetical protein [Pedobacter nutrimenti]